MLLKNVLSGIFTVRFNELQFKCSRAGQTFQYFFLVATLAQSNVNYDSLPAPPHNTVCKLYCTALHCTVLYCTVLYCTVPGVSSGSGLPSLSFIVKLYQGHDPPFPTTAQRPPSGSPLSELLMFVIPTLSLFCPPSCRRAPLVGPADQALHTPRF